MRLAFGKPFAGAEGPEDSRFPSLFSWLVPIPDLSRGKPQNSSGIRCNSKVSPASNIPVRTCNARSPTPQRDSPWAIRALLLFGQAAPLQYDFLYTTMMRDEIRCDRAETN